MSGLDHFLENYIPEQQEEKIKVASTLEELPEEELLKLAAPLMEKTGAKGQKALKKLLLNIPRLKKKKPNLAQRLGLQEFKPRSRKKQPLTQRGRRAANIAALSPAIAATGLFAYTSGKEKARNKGKTASVQKEAGIVGRATKGPFRLLRDRVIRPKGSAFIRTHHPGFSLRNRRNLAQRLGLQQFEPRMTVREWLSGYRRRQPLTGRAQGLMLGAATLPLGTAYLASMLGKKELAAPKGKGEVENIRVRTPSLDGENRVSKNIYASANPNIYNMAKTLHTSIKVARHLPASASEASIKAAASSLTKCAKARVGGILAGALGGGAIGGGLGFGAYRRSKRKDFVPGVLKTPHGFQAVAGPRKAVNKLQKALDKKDPEAFRSAVGQVALLDPRYTYRANVALAARRLQQGKKKKKS